MTTINSYHREHPVYAEQDENGVWSIWKYMDGTLIKNTRERDCPRCGKAFSKEEHDKCIANLPNVKFACCGHGVEDGYAKLDNGKVITFNTNYDKDKIIELINEHL